MKKTITESLLRNIIAESIKKCLDEYHSTPNTNMYAWRGQKTGEGAIDKDGYPIQKPVQTPKPIGNQKAAPIDDRMKKMNEGLFNFGKNRETPQQKADREYAEWRHNMQIKHDNRRAAEQSQQQDTFTQQQGISQAERNQQYRTAQAQAEQECKDMHGIGKKNPDGSIQRVYWTEDNKDIDNLLGRYQQRGDGDYFYMSNDYMINWRTKQILSKQGWYR